MQEAKTQKQRKKTAKRRKEEQNSKKKKKKKERQKNKQQRPPQERPIKICPICEKTHQTRSQTCQICTSKRKKYGANINVVMSIKRLFPDVWQFIEENPHNFWAYAEPRHKRMARKREERKNHRQEDFFDRSHDDVPYYVKQLMEKYPDRRLIGITGKRTDATIHFVCLRCNEEQALLEKEFSGGHGCTATKSSGEVLVENFLTELKVPFKTQRDTLRCINPKTKAQLPYDIEITGRKILIEVQGDQHFRYIEHFHRDYENFEYQKRKDDYKKRWAEHKGYQLMYIDYSEIRSGSFKRKLINAFNQM